MKVCLQKWSQKTFEGEYRSVDESLCYLLNEVRKALLLVGKGLLLWMMLGYKLTIAYFAHDYGGRAELALRVRSQLYLLAPSPLPVPLSTLEQC